MRVCLLGINRLSDDPRARALAASLVGSGHEVEAVAGGDGVDVVDGISIQRVPTHPLVPLKRSRMRRLLRRVPASAADQTERVAEAVARLRADVIYPTHFEALAIATEVARSLELPIVAPPGWDAARDVDAAWIAPVSPERLPAARGHIPLAHRAPAAGAGWDPIAGRHTGRRMALAYRRRERSPGRYVEAALRRAGIEPVVVEEVLDWDRLGDVEAVLIVESPLPALEVRGRRRNIPVVYWVHHGEHHLALNLRLVERYGVDLVLLAHSWHLAHRFPVEVERWPFAVPQEVIERGPAPRERSFDVGFVGSHVSGGGAYDRRGQMLEQVAGVVPEHRLAVVDGVSPEELGRLYGDSRVVLNEGGRRHHPVTMRVFEAIGAGALLVTEMVPGLDRLFRPDEHLVTFAGDAAAAVTGVLADPERLARTADAAATFARGHHTYDHRVDELMHLLESRQPVAPGVPPRARSGLAGLLDADPEVQRIVTDRPAALRRAFPDREIWDLAAVRSRLRPDSYEAVVIYATTEDLGLVVASAWRYVYAAPGLAAEAVETTVRPDRTTYLDTADDGAVRIDLDPASYRIPRANWSRQPRTS